MSVSEVMSRWLLLGASTRPGTSRARALSLRCRFYWATRSPRSSFCKRVSRTCRRHRTGWRDCRCRCTTIATPNSRPYTLRSHIWRKHWPCTKRLSSRASRSRYTAAGSRSAFAWSRCWPPRQRSYPSRRPRCRPQIRTSTSPRECWASTPTLRVGTRPPARFTRSLTSTYPCVVSSTARCGSVLMPPSHRSEARSSKRVVLRVFNALLIRVLVWLLAGVGAAKAPYRARVQPRDLVLRRRQPSSRASRLHLGDSHFAPVSV